MKCCEYSTRGRIHKTSCKLMNIFGGRLIDKVERSSLVKVVKTRYPCLKNSKIIVRNLWANLKTLFTFMRRNSYIKTNLKTKEFHRRFYLRPPIIRKRRSKQGILKGGSITVPLTSCLTGFKSAV